jgi:hypothetical protein
MELELSSIQDGETDVPLNPRLTFRFSNNVIAADIRGPNAAQFTLSDAGGANIPINVIMADEQLERELRNYIHVEPVASLSPGTTFTLTIGAALEANNGNTLAGDITFTFTTVAAATQQTPATQQAQPAQTPNPQTHDNINTALLLSVLSGVVVLIGVGGIILYKKRRATDKG